MLVVTCLTGPSAGCARSHDRPPPELDFEARIAAARCEAWGPSCPAPGALDDVALCAWRAELDAGLRRIDAVLDGSAVLDEVALAECIAGMRCGEPDPARCGDVVVGLTPAGGSCADDATCEPGTYCARRGGCGTCAPELALGEHCSDAAQCAPSPDGPVACWGPEGAAPACVVLRPSERLSTEGEGCDPVELSPTHWETPRCAAPLVCLAEEDDVPRCLPPRGSGGACLEDAHCEAPLVCPPFGRCRTGELRTERGAACQEHPGGRDPALLCEPRTGLVCWGNACVSPPARIGARCNWVDGCGPGLTCQEETCRDRGMLPDGGFCAHDRECASRRCGLSHACVPRASC